MLHVLIVLDLSITKMVFLILCMAGYHGNAHISKITVLKQSCVTQVPGQKQNIFCHKTF